MYSMPKSVGPSLMAEDCFMLFDTILTFNGLRIFESTDGQQLLNYAFRVLSPMVIILRIVGIMVCLFGGNGNRFIFLYLVQAMTAFLCFYYLLKRRERIRQFYEEFFIICKNQLKRKLHSKANIFFGCYLIGLLAEGLSLGLVWFARGTDEWLMSYNIKVTKVSSMHMAMVGSDLIAWTLFGVGFAFAQMMTFAFVLYSLDKAHQNYILFYEKQLCEAPDESNSIPETINEFRKLRSKYQDMKEAFNDLIAVFIFLWFGQMFLETGIRLATRNDTDKSVWFAPSVWAEYLVQMVFIMGFTLFVNKLKEEEEEREKQFVQKIILREDDALNLKETMIMVTELIQAPVTATTGWNMFDVDKRMLLGFFGASLPFGVMVSGFLQEKTICINIRNITDSCTKIANATKNWTIPYVDPPA